MKLAIRRISLASLGKFGCFLGVVAAFVPSLLFGLLGLAVVKLLLKWLSTWQHISISVLGREIANFDLTQVLGLSRFLTDLQTIAGASFAVLVLVVLGLALVSGVILAAIVMAVGLVYNLLAGATGGLVVDATVVHELPPAGKTRSRVGRSEEDET